MTATVPDTELKTRHAAMWASGDYPGMVETFLLPLGPRLVDAAGAGAGRRVLARAARNGHPAPPRGNREPRHPRRPARRRRRRLRPDARAAGRRPRPRADAGRRPRLDD